MQVRPRIRILARLGLVTRKPRLPRSPTEAEAGVEVGAGAGAGAGVGVQTGAGERTVWVQK